MKILVVDDAPALSQLLDAYLTGMGHEVVTLDSGVAVEDTIRGAPFDAVFTDVAMPGFSGWQVLEVVRAVRPGTPVVLMTGWDAARPPESETARPDAVVEKPFKLDQIKDVLATVTRRGAR